MQKLIYNNFNNQKTDLSEGPSFRGRQYNFYFINGGNNFGDAINKLFFSLLIGPSSKIIALNENENKNIEHFLATGSILGAATDKSKIFGTGFIDENSELGGGMRILNNNKNYINLNSKNIIAVRGPKTREKFKNFGINCPDNYGDPLIMFPSIYSVPLGKEIQKKNMAGIIPHSIDKNSDKLPILINNLKKLNLDIKIIDINVGEDYKSLLNNINECEYIFSSSLHGMMMGIVYNKKTFLKQLSNKVIGNTFKFEDFCESIDSTLNNDFNYLDVTLENYIKVDYNKLNNLAINLINLAPFIENDRKRELINNYKKYYSDQWQLVETFSNVTGGSYQEYYLNKALEELNLINLNISIKTDHVGGHNYINKMKVPLTFPMYLVDFINKLDKTKTKEYNFMGTITSKRDWIKKYKNNNSIIEENNYGRSKDKFLLHENYYKKMCNSKFTLCPTGDCPWSYRFFESILCLSIPILEEKSNDIFADDYFFYYDLPVQKNHIYDKEKALENYTKFLQSKHFLKNIF